MKKQSSISLSACHSLVWLVMFTGWFDLNLAWPLIRGAWGFGFMIFVVFPMGMKWLRGENQTVIKAEKLSKKS